MGCEPIRFIRTGRDFIMDTINNYSFARHINNYLEGKGLQLNADGRTYYDIYVSCGEWISIPDHFVEKICVK